MKKNTLSVWADWIMRLTLAFIFILAGSAKLFITTTATFSANLGIPVWLGWFAVLGELAGGIGIIAGGVMKNKTGDLVTRLSGALIAFIMTVAFFMVKTKGFSPDIVKGIEASFDVIAIFAMGLFYALNGNNTESNSR